MAAMPGNPNPGSVSDKLYKVLSDEEGNTQLSLSDLLVIHTGAQLISEDHLIAKNMIQ